MENKNFYNLFKKKIKEIPEDEFPFEEGTWDNVVNVLNEERILMPPPKDKYRSILFGLLFLSLLGNVLLGGQFFKSKKNIQQYSKTISLLKDDIQTCQATATSLSKKNAKYESTKTITPNLLNNNTLDRYTQHLKNNINKPPFSFRTPQNNAAGQIRPSFKLSTLKPFDQSILNTIPTSSLTSSVLIKDIDTKNDDYIITNGDQGIEIKELEASVTEENNQTKEIENIEEREVSMLPLWALGLLKSENFNLSLTPYLDTLEQKKASFRDKMSVFAQNLKPTNYNTGFEFGGGLIQNDLTNANPSDFEYTNIGYGLSGEVAFKNAFRIGVGATYRISSLKFENIRNGNYGDDDFMNYPAIVPTYPDDELNEIEGDVQQIDLPLYAKFMLRPNHRLSPYLGFGIKGQYHIKQTFEYYMLSAPDFLVSYEVKNLEGSYQQLEFNTWTTLFGVEYNYNKFLFSIGGRYERDFKPTGFDQNQKTWINGNISVRYQF